MQLVISAFSCYLYSTTDEISDVENKPIVYREIFDLFEARRCPLLAGKPKLFFLQACRGGMTYAASNAMRHVSIAIT